MDEEERAKGSSVSGVVAADQTPEQLVSRAIAPVKKKFLRPPPVRSSAPDDDVSIPTENNNYVLAMETKSKRQLKRERLEVRQLLICMPPQMQSLSAFSNCCETFERYRDKSRHKTYVPKLRRRGMLVRVLIKTNVVRAMIWKASWRR